MPRTLGYREHPPLTGGSRHAASSRSRTDQSTGDRGARQRPRPACRSRHRNGRDRSMTPDAQLALWMLYELHYRGFDGVPEDREWDLGLLGLRRELEHRFENELARRRGALRWPLSRRTATWRDQLLALIAADDEPVPGRVPAARCLAGAGARLPARAQRAAAQGVRPAVVRAPPDHRVRQGRPRRAAVRRVRRRPTGAPARHASSPTRSGPPGSTPPTAPTSTTSRRSRWRRPT